LVSVNAAWRLRLPQGARLHAVAWTREREALWRATGARPRVAVWDADIGSVSRIGSPGPAVTRTTICSPIRTVGRYARIGSRTLPVLVRKLDLPPVRFHDLRHGAASLAGAAGVELKVIQHDLGHSSAVTTADTYWTVFRELAHRAVAATAGLLRSHARFRMRLGAASQA
jgi:integrase